MAIRKIQPKQIDLEKLSTSLNLNDKAPINNPTFTGTVNLPPVNEENNTVAATVGYVDEMVTKQLEDVVTSPESTEVDRVAVFSDESGNVIKDGGCTIQEIINQNAFSAIKVAEVAEEEIVHVEEIVAEDVTDSIILAAGSNVELVPATDNKAIIIEAQDTTYEEATTEQAGLLSAEDKAKVDTIDDKLNAPVNNSEVGHFIKIAAIDENGNIIATESSVINQEVIQVDQAQLTTMLEEVLV